MENKQLERVVGVLIQYNSDLPQDMGWNKGNNKRLWDAWEKDKAALNKQKKLAEASKECVVRRIISGLRNSPAKLAELLLHLDLIENESNAQKHPNTPNLSLIHI